jgi:hypothetical protein
MSKSLKNALEKFENPGCEYRGAPFWAWNGKLDTEELRRQIRLMKEMGLGGFFMHSRVGLDTEYLSDEWFDCVKACIDEAEKLDMKAWLYDEDRWPSGAAGGLVTKNPEYRTKHMALEILDKASEFDSKLETAALFTAKIDGATVDGLNKITEKELSGKLSKDEKILHFYLREENKSDWYNGYTYLDTLNEKAVGEFIKVTHEAYREKIGKHFGDRVPGIFTDEPSYGLTLPDLNIGNEKRAIYLLSWTAALPEIFRKRYGYDILEHLPELFFDVKGIEMSKARYHYYDCATQTFVDAFSRQIGDWCDKNNMMFTGHVLEEDTLSSQTARVGSCMRFYEYMQAPGMDLLTEYWRIYDVAKQVSSAARQFGRKWRLTETYGCTGWDFNFAGHKALGDWQTALGINLRCQHLAWYTMEGEAKRDYPASIFYQSPWWQEYSKVEDYFGRINSIMTDGSEVRDVLVVHPNESMWTMPRIGWRENRDAYHKKVSDYDKMLVELRDSLLDENIDFDYGDEEIMSRHATVKKGILNVGQAEYKVVVVPPLKTMRSTTLSLLKEFKASGGTVIFAGKVAEYLDAEPSKAVKEFAAECVKTPAKGKELAIESAKSGRRLSILDSSGNEINPALYLLRETEEAWHLFICNTSVTMKKSDMPRLPVNYPKAAERKESFDDVKVIFYGDAEGTLELDPDSGEVFETQSKNKKGCLEIATSLPVLGSRLYLIPKGKVQEKYPKLRKQTQMKRTKLKNDKWDFRLTENNVLVLDQPKFRIEDGKWETANDFIGIDDKVRIFLGGKPRGGSMCQPWTVKKDQKFKKAKIQLKYSFEVQSIPEGELYLALEQPATFKISLNSKPVCMDMESGWWCDRSLKKIPLPTKILNLGENELLLECDYDLSHPGLEMIYLLGAFGTKIKNTRQLVINQLPAELKIGDWVKQGLTFYSGSVVYNKKIKVDLKKGERLVIKVPEYKGTAVRISVDGKEAGIIAWDPQQVDITELVKGLKSANLQVEVIGHRRNSHGPFHFIEKWPAWTGPGQYRSVGEFRTEKYQLVPCGLMENPELLIMK